MKESRTSANTRAESAEQSMPIDGSALRALFEAGTAWLKVNQQTVNALNVFPVPDGDTGTNMLLTMQAACAEIAPLQEVNAGRIARHIAQGALMGARGNSGVILSQLLRGFARTLDNFETLDAKLFVNALDEAQKTAYKGVVRPVEGTILTVAKDAAAAAQTAFQEGATLKDILQRIVNEADRSVQRTPELLPILKQAGVVDSGGKGLFYILEGMLRSLNGQPVDSGAAAQPVATLVDLKLAADAIEPGQEVEVVIDFTSNSQLIWDDFYRDLGELGTSIQVGEGDGFYRMHIHTTVDKQYDPIEYIRKIGTWQRISMENLIAQTDSLKTNHKSVERVPLAEINADQIGIVAVSPGPGISDIFASLGANAIVQGGQTMNPSTEEILASFAELPAQRIIILPNNKNIVLAAENCVALSDKEVVVVPSKTIPQGIAALFAYNPDGELHPTADEMKAAFAEVQSAEVTIATRTVEMNGVSVQAGQAIGLLDGKLSTAGENVLDVVLEVLRKANAQDHELITILYGENVTADEAQATADLIQTNFPDQEIELKDGGQPHYWYILAIE